MRTFHQVHQQNLTLLQAVVCRPNVQQIAKTCADCTVIILIRSPQASHPKYAYENIENIVNCIIIV